jgi:hypothetical protein
MEKEVKLICKVNKSNLPTAFPVYYFVAPNNKIYLIYSQMWGESGFQYTIAILKDKKLSYNYEKEKLSKYENNGWREFFFPELAFHGHKQPMKIIETERLDKTNLTDVTAKAYIDKLINKKMISTKPPKGKMIRTKPLKGK